LDRPERGFTVTADGETVRVVQPIAESDLPKAARSAVRKLYRKNTLSYVRKVTETGDVSYRMEVMYGDDDSDLHALIALIVTPEGKISEEYD